MESCAKSNLKKVSLELGGKSPLIVFGDCDLDKAVKGAMSSVFFNKGENCIAAGRIFVEETVYDEFLDRVVAETKTMAIGDPLDRGTQHGPQGGITDECYVSKGDKESKYVFVITCQDLRLHVELYWVGRPLVPKVL